MNSSMFKELDLKLFNHDEEEEGRLFLNFDANRNLKSSGYFRDEDHPDVALIEDNFDSFVEFLRNNFRFNTINFTLTMTPVNSIVSLVYNSEKSEQDLVALSFSENRPFVSEDVISESYLMVLSISKALNIPYPEKLDLVAVAVGL